MNEDNNKEFTEDKNKYKDLKKGFKSYSKIITISINLVITILMGVIVGLFIDKKMETKYWIVICVFLFSGFAMYNFFKEIMKVK